MSARPMALIGLLVAACGSKAPAPPPDNALPGPIAITRTVPRATADIERPIAAIHLEVDVARRRGVGRYEIAPLASDSGLTLEVGNLSIEAVRDAGGDLKHAVRDKQLDIGIPAATSEITIVYRYGVELQFNGALPSDSTFTWPTFCGNLFPCRSAPRQGSTYTLALSGVPDGKTAVYPRALATAVPAYVLAWTVDTYKHHALGKTDAGTRVGYDTTADHESELAAGTRTLVAAVQWLETTLGPYAFGDELGPVSTNWGESSYETMEHHPFWHVSSASTANVRDHVHQAAHGWFGNGVRIACWEDFLLSEGTTSYLTARIVEATEGKAEAEAVWSEYEARLDTKLAWPKGCGGFDVLADGLTTTAPYFKGALFFRSLEARVGREALDTTLGRFYRANVGTARRFSELLEHIEKETGYDPRPCADEWLREPYPPAEKSCP